MMDIYSEPFQASDALVGMANPEIQILEDQATYGRFSVEPLERGLGTTIGNSVRRVLLSSIESAAITWVKIQGIQHEYSTITHVTEDVTEFLLNVKGIRLKSNSDQPGRLFLDVEGEREVMAGDISPAAEYEVANPDLHLATMDSEEAASQLSSTWRGAEATWLPQTLTACPSAPCPWTQFSLPFAR